MQHYSPKQVAQALGVSEASMKRWCDRGAIPFQRTLGGHRRIVKQDILHFVRTSKFDLVNPAVLGLPTAAREAEFDQLPELNVLVDCFVSGDMARLRGLVIGYYLSGAPLTGLYDKHLAPAFHEIGARWERREIEVYQERSAVEICYRLLLEMIGLMRKPGEGAPFAMGAALSGDPYSLTNIMVESLVRDMGWRSLTLGVNLTGESLAAAVKVHKPWLLWLSCSHVDHEARFVADLKMLWQACLSVKTRLVVGGRALSQELRGRIRYTTYCAGMSDLIDFLMSVAPDVPD